MATIIVGNKWDAGAQYIGRGTPLGNPWPMRDKSEAERNRVCDLYEDYLTKEIEKENPRIVRELNRLADLAERPEGVTLGCFCKGKRCHGDTVKGEIEKILEKRVERRVEEPEESKESKKPEEKTPKPKSKEIISTQRAIQKQTSRGSETLREGGSRVSGS